MAMASWMFRGRSLRSGRSSRSRHDSEDDVQLDFSREAAENAREILDSVCRKQGITEGKRFSYLTAFIKLISKSDIDAGDLGYTTEEIQCCLRVCLIHESTQVRAAALRAVRYLLREERDVRSLYRLQYPTLIARSLDVALRNDMERVQALRLARRMLALAPSDFPSAVVRALVALANGAADEKDRMLRASLAALAEICIVNAGVFLRCGGASAVARNVLTSSAPRIVESLCAVLLHLVNTPATRAQAGVRLDALAAPFCDFNCTTQRNRDEREALFASSRLALLSVLRSWCGVLHFCAPGSSSGLRALVGVLHLRQLEVRKAVLELFYDLLNLPLPDWTDEFSVALEAVDPCRPQEGWKLGEGFVAAEGKALLPHLAKYRPSVVDCHMALLLYTFLEAGLLDALVEVIITSDTFISVRATVLLGELLHMIHRLLPPACCDLTPALPRLLSAALRSEPAAVRSAAALTRLHAQLERGPAPASLFLDRILQPARPRPRHHQLPLRDVDEALRDSGVLANKDSHAWNWSVIRALLKSRCESLRKAEDSSRRSFLKRLVGYYKPSSHQFSRVDAVNRRHARTYTLAGCELIDLLISTDELSEGCKLLTELVADISSHVEAITTSKSAHDCLFSPQNIGNSLCQDYFLFVGRLCHTGRGVKKLDAAGIFQQLLDLVVSTNHDCYVKLVVSSLDYSQPDSLTRVILSKALTGAGESSRLYTTQFLLVLLRARPPGFEQWGIELLVTQLYDQSKAVRLAALTALGEAADEKVYLEAIIALRPSLLHLGDKGLLLLVKFLSTDTGFTFLNDAGFVATQLDRWGTSFNFRYARIVEGELHDALTLHRRGEDGRYSRRTTSARTQPLDVLVPAHLYGELASTVRGFAALTAHTQLPLLVQCVISQRCQTDQEVLELKASLWALGHVATSARGVAYVSEAGALAAMVDIAQGCQVYSLRGTAFYALGLVATTRAGVHQLGLLGWLCVRHHRHERWPVIEAETENGDDAMENDEPNDLVTNNRLPSDSSLGGFYIGGDDSWSSGVGGDVARKCATLPASAGTGSGMGPGHSRSRSESQPGDNWFLGSQRSSLMSVTPPTGDDRQRRLDSESSAISSEDSIFPPQNSDRLPSLSPVPSGSSLTTLAYTANDDSIGVPTPRRQTLSSEDALGYATVRSMNRHRRPLLSEGSNLTTELLGLNVHRPMHNFGYEFESAVPPSLPSAGPSSASLAGARSYYSSRGGQRAPVTPAPGPPAQSYMGIALPARLEVLFPPNEARAPVIAAEPEGRGEDSGSDSSSRDSPVKSRRDSYKHATRTCLACSRDPHARDRKVSTSSTHHRQRTETESSFGGGESPLLFPRRKHSRSASGCLLAATPGASFDSTASLDIGSQSGLDLDLSRGPVRKELLKHVERLGNPVWGRQARQALLQLKQTFPTIFQDVCVFSDVSARVGSATYRLGARRFVQELFLDLTFDVLYDEPAAILQLSTTSRPTDGAPSPHHSSSSLHFTTLSPGGLARSPGNAKNGDKDAKGRVQSALGNISEEKVAQSSPVVIRRSDPVPVVASTAKPSAGFVVRSPPLAVVTEESAPTLIELKRAFLFPEADEVQTHSGSWERRRQTSIGRDETTSGDSQLSNCAEADGSQVTAKGDCSPKIDGSTLTQTKDVSTSSATECSSEVTNISKVDPMRADISKTVPKGEIDSKQNVEKANVPKIAQKKSNNSKVDCVKDKGPETTQKKGVKLEKLSEDKNMAASNEQKSSDMQIVCQELVSPVVRKKGDSEKGGSDSVSTVKEVKSQPLASAGTSSGERVACKEVAMPNTEDVSGSTLKDVSGIKPAQKQDSKVGDSKSIKEIPEVATEKQLITTNSVTLISYKRLISESESSTADAVDKVDGEVMLSCDSGEAKARIEVTSVIPMMTAVTSAVNVREMKRKVGRDESDKETAEELKRIGKDTTKVIKENKKKESIKETLDVPQKESRVQATKDGSKVLNKEKEVTSSAMSHSSKFTDAINVTLIEQINAAGKDTKLAIANTSIPKEILPLSATTAEKKPVLETTESVHSLHSKAGIITSTKLPHEKSVGPIEALPTSTREKPSTSVDCEILEPVVMRPKDSKVVDRSSKTDSKVLLPDTEMFKYDKGGATTESQTALDVSGTASKPLTSSESLTSESRKVPSKPPIDTSKPVKTTRKKSSSPIVKKKPETTKTLVTTSSSSDSLLEAEDVAKFPTKSLSEPPLSAKTLRQKSQSPVPKSLDAPKSLALASSSSESLPEPEDHSVVPKKPLKDSSKASKTLKEASATSAKKGDSKTNKTKSVVPIPANKKQVPNRNTGATASVVPAVKVTKVVNKATAPKGALAEKKDVQTKPNREIHNEGEGKSKRDTSSSSSVEDFARRSE